MPLHAPRFAKMGLLCASYDAGGLIMCNVGTLLGPAEGYDDGAVLGVAVNTEERVLYFRRDGAWIGGASPEQGNGFYYGEESVLPMVTLSEDDLVTTNFGASPFQYPPPEGYQPGW